MERGYVKTAEGQVHYIMQGAGDPLLLIPMSPLPCRMFLKLIPLLSQGHRVVALDLLGFGNSDDAPARYEAAGDHAENVSHVMDSLGVKRADIVGAISGAIVAAELAIRQPERVRRLVALGFPISLTPEERRARVEGTRSARSQFDFVHDMHGQYLKDIVELGALGNARAALGNRTDNEYKVNFQFIDDWVTGAIRLGPARASWGAKVYGHDNQARLPLVKAPTLVIGLAGVNVGPSVKGEQRAQAVQSLIPHSRLAMLNGPGADLQVAYERAEDVAQLVLPFLAEPDRP